MTLVAAWWCLFLFGGAGTLGWSRGWICTVLYLGGLCATKAILGRLNPELLAQRRRAIREDTKSFDRLFLRIFLFLTIVEPMVAGLDAVRFKWVPMPPWTVYPGVLSFLFSAVWIAWVLVENPHAESSVRIQRDRGHAVVASGPYRFVRHPMYVGIIQLHQAMALILGSTWTMGLATVITLLFFWRTALEDRTLRRELPGYEAYAAATRFRLMPGIW
jgi:protein-S-isoprenylcysteine O-methyltransferase Ste14